jgi:hypothetical protein
MDVQHSLQINQVIIVAREREISRGDRRGTHRRDTRDRRDRRRGRDGRYVKGREIMYIEHLDFIQTNQELACPKQV